MPAFRVHIAGLALLAAVSLSVAPLGAQVTVRCIAETYGITTYTRCSDGTRSTSERVGSTVYTRDNIGRRSTLDANGSTATYRDNRGTRGMIDAVGSTLYYRDNRGTRVTLDTYGGTATLAASAPRSSRRPTSGGDVVRPHEKVTQLSTKVWKLQLLIAYCSRWCSARSKVPGKSCVAEATGKSLAACRSAWNGR